MEWTVLQDASQTLLSQSPTRWAWAAVTALAWLAVCLQAGRHARWRSSGRTPPAAAAFSASNSTLIPAPGAISSSANSGDGFLPNGSEPHRVLIAWASQFGTAEQQAWQTAKALQAAGHAVEVQPLDALAPAQCVDRPAVFFIVSTTGDGDPPDHAAGFADDFMREPSALLQGQPFAVLALGDREYEAFCGFGLRLAAWMQDGGAHALWPTIQVDNGDADAVSAWQTQVAQWIDAAPAPLPNATGTPAPAVSGSAPPAEQDMASPFLNWRLTGRRHLNPGSQGEPMMLIDLTAPVDLPSPLRWEPGDLLQVVRPGNDERPRDYSIACVCDPSPPAQVQLLVRKHRRSDGSPGHVSAWLTEECALESLVVARLRSHASFRLPRGLMDRPLILVGNGTGLAGLRAHMQAAEQALWDPTSARARLLAEGHHAWMILGERQQVHDELLDAEIAAAVSSGVLSRVDRAYSRDDSAQRYVQDVLRGQADRLREWLNHGAVLLLCGSLSMASGVEDAIDEVMGLGTTLNLRRQGLLRRDVY